MEWFEIWKKPVVRQAERIWEATAFLDRALPSKEGARSISGTVGSCDSGTLGGGFVRAPARRLRRWIWAARTSSRIVGRLSGGGTPKESDGSGMDCWFSVEVAMAFTWSVVLR